MFSIGRLIQLTFEFAALLCAAALACFAAVVWFRSDDGHSMNAWRRLRTRQRRECELQVKAAVLERTSSSSELSAGDDSGASPSDDDDDAALVPSDRSRHKRPSYKEYLMKRRNRSRDRHVDDNDWQPECIPENAQNTSQVHWKVHKIPGSWSVSRDSAVKPRKMESFQSQPSAYQHSRVFSTSVDGADRAVQLNQSVTVSPHGYCGRNIRSSFQPPIEPRLPTSPATNHHQSSYANRHSSPVDYVPVKETPLKKTVLSISENSAFRPIHPPSATQTPTALKPPMFTAAAVSPSSVVRPASEEPIYISIKDIKRHMPAEHDSASKVAEHSVERGRQNARTTSFAQMFAPAESSRRSLVKSQSLSTVAQRDPVRSVAAEKPFRAKPPQPDESNLERWRARKRNMHSAKTDSGICSSNEERAAEQSSAHRTLSVDANRPPPPSIQSEPPAAPTTVEVTVSQQGTKLKRLFHRQIALTESFETEQQPVAKEAVEQPPKRISPTTLAFPSEQRVSVSPALATDSSQPPPPTETSRYWRLRPTRQLKVVEPPDLRQQSDATDTTKPAPQTVHVDDDSTSPPSSTHDSRAAGVAKLAAKRQGGGEVAESSQRPPSTRSLDIEATSPQPKPAVGDGTNVLNKAKLFETIAQDERLKKQATYYAQTGDALRRSTIQLTQFPSLQRTSPNQPDAPKSPFVRDFGAAQTTDARKTTNGRQQTQPVTQNEVAAAAEWAKEMLTSNTRARRVVVLHGGDAPAADSPSDADSPVDSAALHRRRDARRSRRNRGSDVMEAWAEYVKQAAIIAAIVVGMACTFILSVVVVPFALCWLTERVGLVSFGERHVVQSIGSDTEKKSN